MGANHKIQSLSISEEALQNHSDIACCSPTGVLLENYFRLLSTKLSIKEKLDLVHLDFIGLCLHGIVAEKKKAVIPNMVSNNCTNSLILFSIHLCSN